MIRTMGLAHVSIPVTDLEQSREFYCNRLGMKLLPSPGGMAFLDAGGGDCVILVRVNKPISTAHDRLVHHAFVVAHDDFETVVQELKASGTEILAEEDMRGGNVNGPRVYLNDPDGNTLELIDLTSYSGNRL
jgi:catechol 2,3-dioxygenase-like lactoylglutathione lyase family enzyme